MSRIRIALAVVALCWSLAPSAMARSSIGANLAFSMFSYEGESQVVITAPSGSTLFLPNVVPGLRFGLLEEARTSPAIEMSWVTLAGSGDSYTQLSIGANLRQRLGQRADAGPYLTAGITALIVSGGGESDSRIVFGGGLGQTVPISDDHGRARFEFRYDRIPSEDEGFAESSAINVFSLKVGFDLLTAP